MTELGTVDEISVSSTMKTGMERCSHHTSCCVCVFFCLLSLLFLRVRPNKSLLSIVSKTGHVRLPGQFAYRMRATTRIEQKKNTNSNWLSIVPPLVGRSWLSVHKEIRMKKKNQI